MTNIGHPFIELPTIDSTNIYAMSQIHAHMASHGTCIITHDQTAGKGQRGKDWLSFPNSNIAMSVILEINDISLHHSFCLSAAVALACYDIFNKAIGDECSIKWPNDIYWRDRKAGGILIENVVQGQNWNFSVAGIGLNINQTDFPSGINAVSLKQITGKHFDYISMSKELCTILEKYWQKFLKNPGQLIDEYNQRLYQKDSLVTFRQNSRKFKGIVRAVNAQGELVLDCPDSQTFSHGAIEWVTSEK